MEDFAVEVSGGRLGVCRYGAASSFPSDAPVALAVHGITGNNRTWLAIAQALAGRVVLVAPDIRGRGDSRELPGPYGMDAHVADLLALVDQLGLERPLLIGHSLGAYIVSSFAVRHPDRVRALLLVDGGLPIPGTEGVDPQAFADAFLGPALARLSMRFPTRQAYIDWWHQHPAFNDGDIAEDNLVAYVEHDTIGEEPELRSSVSEQAVRGDAGELATLGSAASELAMPATLLCAPRGLQNDPNPMQPLGVAQAWAAGAPDRREARLVEDVNHYTITLGARGAQAVAETILGR